MVIKEITRQTPSSRGTEKPPMSSKAISEALPKRDGIVRRYKLKKLALPKYKPDDLPLSPSSKSPILNEIDDPLRSTFITGRPMGGGPETLQCKHCKRPILRTSAASHIKICLQKKIDRAQRKKEQKEATRKAREAREKGKIEDAEGEDGKDDDESESGSKVGGKNIAAGANGISSKAKKRKADGEVDSEPKKKKTKKELEREKPKAAKPKGPVDVEKQCGVLLPDGRLCARSLTCKSHAMGAKRAVPGRSLPYDKLLAAYQKKNQAKQQKAAIDANAPLPDDLADSSGPVDSDEEKDAVMAAIARSRPLPAAQHVFVPLRKKYAYIRMKEMLSQALGGRGGGNIFGGTGSNSTSAIAGPSQSHTDVVALTDAERRASIVVPGSARSSFSGVTGAGISARRPSGAIIANG